MSDMLLLNTVNIPQELFDQEYIVGVESGWAEQFMFLHGRQPRDHAGVTIWIDEACTSEVEAVLKQHAIGYQYR